MKKKSLIEINYANKVDVVYRDFGNFKSDKKIKVNLDFWMRYVVVRKTFEVMQRELEEKVK